MIRQFGIQGPVHVQMGLDTKRAEMAKLEERARQRAAALAQARMHMVLL